MKKLKIGLLLFGLLAGILFVYAVFNFWNAASRQKTLADEWRQTTGVSPDELVAAFPKTEKNESARELERLAAQLGINESEDNEGARLTRDYFAERETDASLEAEELPENIKKYLAIHRNDLDALYSFVRQNNSPEWETDASRRGTMPSPNLSFHNRLHQIIALDALNRTGENQSEQALKAFEASRKASEFFRERPEAAFQMINLLAASTQNYVVRKMNDVPADQRERLAAGDYRRLAARVLEYEYASEYLLPNSENSMTPQNLTDKVFPFSRFNAALDTSEAVWETVADLQRRDFCSPSNSNGGAKLAWWNTGGKIVFPAALQIWRNFVELSYDAELTEKVLRLKEFRATSAQPDLPPELTRMKSTLCDDSNWTVEKQSNGSLIISLNRAADLIKDEKTPLIYTLPTRK